MEWIGWGEVEWKGWGGGEEGLAAVMDSDTGLAAVVN